MHLKIWSGDRDVRAEKAKYHIQENYLYLCLNFTDEETEAKATKQLSFFTACGISFKK